MAIAYMVGIVFTDGSRSLWRDPRAEAGDQRPGRLFATPTEAMSVLPLLPWRKCGGDPHDVDAYGKNGEIYYLVQIDTSIFYNPERQRRSNTKLTTGIR